MLRAIVALSPLVLVACGSIRLPEISRPTEKRPAISGYDENHDYITCEGLLKGELCGKAPTDFTAACKDAQFNLVYCKNCQRLCTGDVIIN